LAETINGLDKTGVIHRRGPWRNGDAVKCPRLDRGDGFNNRRRLEQIDNGPPVESDAAHHRQQHESALAR